MESDLKVLGVRLENHDHLARLTEDIPISRVAGCSAFEIRFNRFQLGKIYGVAFQAQLSANTIPSRGIMEIIGMVIYVLRQKEGIDGSNSVANPPDDASAEY
jgi:hypothetical protein